MRDRVWTDAQGSDGRGKGGRIPFVHEIGYVYRPQPCRQVVTCAAFILGGRFSIVLLSRNRVVASGDVVEDACAGRKSSRVGSVARRKFLSGREFVEYVTRLPLQPILLV